MWYKICTMNEIRFQMKLILFEIDIPNISY